MERKIEIYSEITGGVKRCNIDLMINGAVKDRCTEEGYTHAGVDEYAMRDALRMAEMYSIQAQSIVNHGTLEYLSFCKLSGR